VGVLGSEFTGKASGKETSVFPGGTAPNGVYSQGIGTVGTFGAAEEMDKIYKDPTLYHENWYLQKPYAFVFTDRKGNVSTFYLPISPSNLNITTHFATNTITTMYGTVEEHSEQRYYDIVISGTTGMSPRYFEVIEDQKLVNPPVVGRAGFPIKVGGDFGGFGKRTQDLIGNALNQAGDLLTLGGDDPISGVHAHRTGYVAFHNFYRWLLVYKKNTSGETASGTRRHHPLKFINFKDSNQYDVSINTFTLVRDANNPMLYNYNIILRAYNLQDADSTDIQLDVQERGESLGLSSDLLETSLFAIMANKARQAKNAAYSAIAAAKGFGG
jgi:hypothetical protein